MRKEFWSIVRIAGRDFVVKRKNDRPFKPSPRFHSVKYAPKRQSKKWGIRIIETVAGKARARLPAPLSMKMPGRLPSVAKVRSMNIGFRHRRPTKRRSMTGIEMRNLVKLAPKMGIESDVFDFKAHIDRTLSYAENKNLLSRKIAGISPLRREVSYQPHNQAVAYDTRRLIGAFELKAELAKFPEGISFSALEAKGFTDKEFIEALSIGLAYEPKPGMIKLIG